MSNHQQIQDCIIKLVHFETSQESLSECEKIVATAFADILTNEQFLDQLLEISIPVMHRILNQYNLNINEMNQECQNKIIGFLFKYEERNGPESSILFSKIDLNHLKIDLSTINNHSTFFNLNNPKFYLEKIINLQNKQLKYDEALRNEQEKNKNLNDQIAEMKQQLNNLIQKQNTMEENMQRMNELISEQNQIINNQRSIIQNELHNQFKVELNDLNDQFFKYKQTINQTFVDKTQLKQVINAEKKFYTDNYGCGTYEYPLYFRPGKVSLDTQQPYALDAALAAIK